MKNYLLWLMRSLLLACFALGSAQQARASHAQAGQLTYTYVSTAANGIQTYRVQVLFFRDCSGITPNPVMNLNAVNSCGGTTHTTVLNPLGFVLTNPYCSTTQAIMPCASGTALVLPNYIAYKYEGTTALPPAAEWVLSVEEQSRPSLANISNPTTLRLEARLHSLITPVGGLPVVLANSSPLFASYDPLIPFASEYQNTTVSFAATDPDLNSGEADSLVYSLERPLYGCGTYETYAPYPVACATGADPRCAGRVVRCTSIGATYSAELPLPVLADTIRPAGPCQPTGVSFADVRPRFSFNARRGSFSFTPTAYQPGDPLYGLNKYVVVGMVTEYRRHNGVYYKVGSVRRDFMVVVQPAFLSNTLPGTPGSVSGPASNNLTLSFSHDTLDVNVATGNYSRLQVDFTDPDNVPGPNQANPLQNLTIITPADINTNLLQGGDIGIFVLTGNGTPTPRATFHFQPGPAGAGTTVLIPFRIEDSGCPIKGVRHQMLRIRLTSLPQLPRIAVAGQSATPVAVASICPGGTLQLLSRISRPDSVRNFGTGQVSAQHYAYQWSSPNANPATNGLPAVRTTPDLSVSPSVDTRYTLSMRPLMGFAPGQFVDTTSIVVRVAALPASITRQGNTLHSSVSSGNQWLLNGQPIAGATAQTYAPTAAGTYAVRVSYTTGAATCTALASQSVAFAFLGQRAALAGTSLTLSPNPSADGRLRVELSGYQHPATLAVYDLLGRAVLAPLTLEPSPAGAVRELDLSRQPAGVYLLYVRTKGGLDVRRLVRQ